MDYTKLTQIISQNARCTHTVVTRAASAFVSAALLIGLPLGAQAAVLKINPGDDAGNVINLTVS